MKRLRFRLLQLMVLCISLGMPIAHAVSLNILNLPSDSGQIVVVSGESIEVEFEISVGEAGNLNNNDEIRLVRVDDNSVVSSRRRGNSLTGTITLPTVSNHALGNLKVEYSNNGSVISSTPDLASEQPILVLSDTAILALVDRIEALEATDPVPGANGLNCWDLNGNGNADFPGEDINQDNQINVYDCQGNDGIDGMNGNNGTNGADGVSCWDTNEDGIPTFPGEDTNQDNQVNVLDCQGIPGVSGNDGDDGADGANGLNCWDLNGNEIADFPDEDVNQDNQVNVLDCQGVPGPGSQIGGSDYQVLYHLSGAAEGSDVYYDPSSSNLGIGTVNPERDLHLVQNEGPNVGVMLEATGTTGHRWNLLSNGDSSGIEGGFSIHDQTAAEHRLVIDQNGNVGIGTTEPRGPLDVEKLNDPSSGLCPFGWAHRDFNLDGYLNPGECWRGLTVDSTGVITAAHRLDVITNDIAYIAVIQNPQYPTNLAQTMGSFLKKDLLETGDRNSITLGFFANEDGGGSPDNRYFANIEAIVENPNNSTRALGLRFLTETLERLRIANNGYVGIGTPTPNYPLQMGSGAHVTVGGVWTNASSRSLKENITEMNMDQANAALQLLNPVTYNYKSQKDEVYAGFIAEDVPDLAAMNDRKSLSPMDIIAILTKVVQGQQEKIEALEKKMK